MGKLSILRRRPARPRTEPQIPIPKSLSTPYFMLKVIHDGFVGNIPMDVLEVFPNNWFFLAGSVTYMVVFGCYIGFFISSFLQGQQQTFVSLDRNAGNCDTVSKPLTGTYLASTEGYWEGSANFRYTQAAYEFNFNQLVAGSEEFKELIQAKLSPRVIGETMVDNDVATNLLIWMHYREREVSENGTVQSMKFFAPPNSVFLRGNVYSGLYIGPLLAEGHTIFCDSQFSSYDPNAGVVAMTLPDTPECNVFATLFSQIITKDGTLIRCNFNINPHSTVAAINQNILETRHLEKLEDYGTFPHEGKELRIGSYYDPATKNSDEFICVDVHEFDTQDKIETMCVVNGGDYLLYPILAHADKYCASCELNSSLAETPCNYYGLIPFYIFTSVYGNDVPAQIVGFLELFKVVRTVELKYAVSMLLVENSTTLFNSLCPTCAIVYAYLGDSYNSISPYRRTLPNGLHCIDSVSSENYRGLTQNPPAVMVENYYVCRLTLMNNIINSVGISFGNTSIFAVIFLAFFLPLLYYNTRKYENHKARRKFKKATRHQVMMRASDGAEKIVEREREPTTDLASEPIAEPVVSEYDLAGPATPPLLNLSESAGLCKVSYAADDCV